MDYKRVGQLVRKFQGGDREAFDRLYSLVYPSQFNFANSMVRDRYAAEDIVQETFLYAYSNIGSLNNPRAFVSWLSRITYCNCVDSLRDSINRKKKEVNLDEYLCPGEENDPNASLPLASEEEYAVKEKRMDVQDAVRSLDLDTQVLLYLKFYSGFKETEIAGIMNIPVGTVKSRLSNSKKKLKKILYAALSLNPFFCLFLHYSAKALKTRSLAFLSCGSHTLRNAILFPAAVTGVSLGVMMNVRNYPPVISQVRLVSYRPASLNQTLDVKVESYDGIQDVLIRENGKTPESSGEALQESGGIFSACLRKNGTYLITARDQNGKTADRTVRISNIDPDYPVIADPEIKGDGVSLALSDATSGIDWDRLRLTDSSGKEIHAVQDRQKGEITCSLSELPLNIRVSDLAGNWQSVRVSFE